MDPATLFQITSGAAALVLHCGKVINDLHSLADRYSHAELTIVSMSTALETIQWAWRHLEKTLLARSLKGGSLVISALEEDLKPYRRLSATFGLMRKTKAIWNGTILKDHLERIRDQVSSMNLLVNVINLSDNAARKQLLDDGWTTFQKSEESAYSIVPTKWSRSISDSASILSFESDKSLIYRQLSIDNELFTARVYKRNYRTPQISSLLLQYKIQQLSIQKVTQDEGETDQKTLVKTVERWERREADRWEAERLERREADRWERRESERLERRKVERQEQREAGWQEVKENPYDITSFDRPPDRQKPFEVPLGPVTNSSEPSSFAQASMGVWRDIPMHRIHDRRRRMASSRNIKSLTVSSNNLDESDRLY